MKPRLKLHTTGEVSVLIPGRLGWDSREARAFIKKHYGGVHRFAAAFRLNYSAACLATQPRSEHLNIRRGGAAAYVRQILGLPSNPSVHSLRLVQANARRRGAVKAETRA